MRIDNTMLRLLSEQQDPSNGDSDSSEDGDSQEEDQQEQGQGEDQDGDSQDQEGSEDGDGQEQGQESEGQEQGQKGDQQGDSAEGGDQQGETEDGQSVDGREPSDLMGSDSVPTSPKSSASKLPQLTEQEIRDGLKDFMDTSEALEQLVADQLQEAQENCQHNEQVYRPLSTQYDKVEPAVAGTKARTKHVVKESKGLTSAFASKLRSKFLEERRVERLHGVRKGKSLSDRRLVDSMIEIKTGRMPTRPDVRDVRKQQTTLAVSILLDESSSMTTDLIKGESIASFAVASALEKLNCPVEVVGFRDGHETTNVSSYQEFQAGGFHREQSFNIDVFKGYDEKISHCKERFASVVARGSTPMADGIHHALQGLSNRTERHRVVLAMTDGCPNNPQIVTRQIRLAKEAGITIVGVGLNSTGCYYVSQLFPTSVLVDNLSELPKKLMACLDSIMFPKKAKKVRFDS